MRRNKPTSKNIYSYQPRHKIDMNTYYETPFDSFHYMDYRGTYYKDVTNANYIFFIDDDSNYVTTEDGYYLIF